jgi:2-methylcitrate dehydratase PrpD
MISISRQLARWACGLTFDDLPEPVVDKLKAVLLHHLAGSLVEPRPPYVTAIVDEVKREAGRPDGATVIGDGAAVTRDGAALASSAILMGSGLYDSFRMVTHPGPALVAVAVANAEVERRTAKELVTALAAGYEVMCRLADDFVPTVSARGYRPAPIFSTMGAAVVAGKLLHLDEDRMAAAISIAANCASGLNEAGRAGGDDYKLHEPNAARQGQFAATAAQLGHVRGSETVIEGEAGFYNAYAGNNAGRLSYVFDGPRRVELAALTDRLGDRFALLNVMFKIYDAPGFDHAVIELVGELTRRHEIDPDDVAELAVHVNYLETRYPSPEFPRWPDAREARVGSTQWYAAYCAVHGSYPVVGSSPGGAVRDNESVDSFMREKVDLVGVYDQPMFSPVVTIRSAGGQAWRGEYPYGRLLWGFDELVARLAGCAPGMRGGGQRLAELADAIRVVDQLESVAPLLELVCTHD